MTKSTLRYIIVGTHKTKPEENGWYIGSKYDEVFWSLLRKKFKSKANNSSTINTFDKRKGYGYIKDFPNILFFDLIKYGEASTSSDSELFDNKETRKNFVNGVLSLAALIKSENVETKVGLIGTSTAGIFYNAIKNTSDKLNEFENIKKLKYKNDYGLINDADFVKFSKTSFFLLENITSRYYKSGKHELKGWQNFYSSNT